MLDSEKSPSFKECYRGVFVCFVVLILADLLFVVMYGLHVIGPFFSSSLFSIESDLGLAEVFQYVKELAIMLLLVSVARRLGVSGLYAWAAVFLYVVVDDAFSLHENLGEHLAQVAEFAPDFLRPRDVGELLVSAVAGGILFSAVGLSYWFGGSLFRSITHDLLLLFAGLVFFGVFVDMVHGGVRMGAVVARVLALIEDGGEMVMMSLILTYAWALRFVPAERRILCCDFAWNYLRKRFL